MTRVIKGVATMANKGNNSSSTYGNDNIDVSGGFPAATVTNI